MLEVLEKAMALRTGDNNCWDWYEGVWTFEDWYFNDHTNGGSYQILSIANQEYEALEKSALENRQPMVAC